ncbi:MAG: aspartate aminotransferase family protein [Betaproteobacteria bacterium]|nr:aspartate aminotransferase family protein [Betaproteobacteria bacterium]
MSHLMNNYARLPVTFSHGEANWLVDTEGRRYLDALSGIAVNTLGHNHPALVRAISEQATRMLHVSNIYRIREQELLSDRLAALSGMSEVFFCNSGCEANEAAIKLARFYGHQRGIETPAIIVMEHAFHGRTLATLSATGNRKTQAGFEPLVPGFIRVPYNDLNAIRAVAARNRDIVAVMLEIVQGEGGIHLASIEYQRELRALCDQEGWLMICDEVQCGMARTGKWFGFQHSGVLPDIITLAKGLASGVPIGACLTAKAAAGLFGPGNHGSTFGGNPLACTAALTTLETIEKDGLMFNAEKIGAYLKQRFAEAFAGLAGVVEIRGQGLMLGIELDRPCGELLSEALHAGLLISVTSGCVIRLLPALTFSVDEADELVRRIVPLVRDFLAGKAARGTAGGNA